MWCGCVKGQTMCGVVVEGSNNVWCACVSGQTVCGICACANCKCADLAIMHKCH